jgi:hypothetical protein
LRALQGPDERLDVWSLNGVLFVVSLGLYTDEIKPERVLADDPIQSAIAGLTGVVD